MTAIDGVAVIKPGRWFPRGGAVRNWRATRLKDGCIVSCVLRFSALRSAQGALLYITYPFVYQIYFSRSEAEGLTLS